MGKMKMLEFLVDVVNWNGIVEGITRDALFATAWRQHLAHTNNRFRKSHIVLWTSAIY